MTNSAKSMRVFEATEPLRRQVETLAAFGVPQEDICRMIVNPRTNKSIGMKTLRKHFRHELDTGAARATAKVVESLYRQAVGSPAQYDGKGKLLRAERPPVLSAAIFWMKTRAKWKQGVELKRTDEANNLAPPADADALDHDV